MEYSPQSYMADNAELRNTQYVKEFLRKKKICLIGVVVLLSFIVMAGLQILCSLFFSQGVVEVIAEIVDLFFGPLLKRLGVEIVYPDMLMPVINIMPLPFCLAVLVIFFQSLSKKPHSVPKAGAVMLHIWGVLGLVIDCIICAILLIPAIATTYSAVVLTVSGDTVGTDILLYCVAGLLFVIFTFILVGAIGRFRLTSSVKRCATNGELVTKGSIPFSVVQITGAVCALIIALVFFVSAMPSDEILKYVFDLFGIAHLLDDLALVECALMILGAAVCWFVISVCMVSFACSFRAHIKEAGDDGRNLSAAYESPRNEDAVAQYSAPEAAPSKEYAYAAQEAPAYSPAMEPQQGCDPVAYEQAPEPVQIYEPEAYEENLEAQQTPEPEAYEEAPEPVQAVVPAYTEEEDEEKTVAVYDEDYLPEAASQETVVTPAAMERRFCANCGFELKSSQKFCPRCGTPAK